MTKKLIVAAALLLSGAVAYHFLAVPVSLALVKQVATKRLSTDNMNGLADGLHIGICGAGAPFPDDLRSGPCTLIIAGQRLFVIDTGSGSARHITAMGFNPGRIEAVFLTHFHSDHIDGLGELMLQRWGASANQQPVTIYGPRGVESVVAGFLQAYEPDHQYRVAHHGNHIMPSTGFGGVAKPFDVPAQGHAVIVKDKDLEISAFAVAHSPVHPAVGYRIRYKDRSVVISGDTSKSAAVTEAAQGVDLLVHEALSAPLVGILHDSADAVGRQNLKQIFTDILNYHTSPPEAAEVAEEAKVGYLLLNHIVPPLPLSGLKKAFLADAEERYKGPIRIAQDGDFISLPVGTKAIEVGSR